MGYIEPAEYILECLRLRGFLLNRGQLVAIHRKDLIERPIQVARNGERATTAFYPAGTAYLVCELMKYRVTAKMPLADWGWQAALHGHPMPDAYWEKLADVGQQLLARVGKVLRIFTRAGEASPSMGNAAHGMFLRIAKRRPLNSVDGGIRRRLGKRRLVTFIRMAMEAAYGGYTSIATASAHDREQENELEQTLGRATGITGPEKKRLPAAPQFEPCWSVSVKELDTMLAHISAEQSGKALPLNNKKRRIVVRQAALELLSLLAKLSAIEQVQRQIYGTSQPGLRFIASTTQQLSPLGFSCGLAFWLVARRIPSVMSGASNLLLCQPPADYFDNCDEVIY